MHTVHASAVAVNGCGVLIRGASGTGKSSLAWGMMSHGAVLISDDQVVLTDQGDIWLSAPDTIRGLIEARGIGILRAPVSEAALRLVVDLTPTDEARLPMRRTTDVLGQQIPLLHKNFTPLLPYILVHYIIHGQQE